MAQDSDATRVPVAGLGHVQKERRFSKAREGYIQAGQTLTERKGSKCGGISGDRAEGSSLGKGKIGR